MRRTFFHSDNSPRKATKFIVQHKSGKPRGPFRRWVRNDFPGDSTLAQAAPASMTSTPVFTAQLIERIFAAPRAEAALFVTHSPDGRIKPHVQHYVTALVHEGIDVYLLVAADRPLTDDSRWLSEICRGLLVRENQGLDFAAWAHVMRSYRVFFDVNILYLINDSLLGPTTQEAFAAVIERIRENPADIVGLTDNFERGWHIQSYFLAIKRKALRAFPFQMFVRDIMSFRDKDEVINNYEVRFAPAMKAAGLSVDQIFKTYSERNPTLYNWRDLLSAGFPFLKVMVAREHPVPGADFKHWRKELERYGYDVTLADQLLDDLNFQRKYPLGERSTSGRRRVSFIGPWNYDNGLGSASRGYVRALMQSDFQNKFLPIPRPFHIHGRVGTGVRVSDFVGPADAAIIHLNALSWRELFDGKMYEEVANAYTRIGIFVWESATLPDDFASDLKSVDAIWVPSRFVADLFRPHFSGPISVVPHVVPIPAEVSSLEDRREIRRRLGLNEACRIILYAFDGTSQLGRKNPQALVRAFVQSDLAERGFVLVLKTKHLEFCVDGQEFLAACSGISGVTIVDQSMSSDELSQLFDAAEIYASSHCSEGFGLTIAEAMARGKTVVATDYGGSTDFLDEKTGFPVRCSVTTLEEDCGVYAQGGAWAKIDEDHLSECLRAAADMSEEERRALSSRAKAQIDRLLSPRVVSALMKANIESLLLSFDCGDRGPTADARMERV